MRFKPQVATYRLVNSCIINNNKVWHSWSSLLGAGRELDRTEVHLESGLEAIGILCTGSVRPTPGSQRFMFIILCSLPKTSQELAGDDDDKTEKQKTTFGSFQQLKLTETLDSESLASWCKALCCQSLCLWPTVPEALLSPAQVILQERRAAGTVIGHKYPKGLSRFPLSMRQLQDQMLDSEKNSETPTGFEPQGKNQTNHKETNT